MRLVVIGSSSAGNSYVLENEREALLIECGVKFNKIKQTLNFQLSKVAGCIVTHEHKDHCIAAQDVMTAGIKVYTTAGTAKAIGIAGHHRCQVIEKGPRYPIGGFKVMAFGVKHDAADPVGYLVQHEETGNVLFLTDTYYVEYTFKNLNNIIVEANYSKEILDERLRRGDSPEFLRNRVLQSHMSLETCKGLLAANDLKQVNNIVLIHLSDSNSNVGQFLREVKQATGKAVHIADAGMIIENFNKTPF